MAFCVGLASFAFLFNDALLQSSPYSALNELHHICQLRLQIGQLAQQKAASEDVKEFGQRLIDEHERTDDEVAEAASMENVQLEEFELKGSERRAIKRLESSSGKDFDFFFAMTVADDNKNDVARLQSALSGLKPDSPSYELVNRLLLSAKMRNMNKQFFRMGLLSYDLGRPR
jgi:predicted outer membrane protein